MPVALLSDNISVRRSRGDYGASAGHNPDKCRSHEKRKQTLPSYCMIRMMHHSYDRGKQLTQHSFPLFCSIRDEKCQPSGKASLSTASTAVRRKLLHHGPSQVCICSENQLAARRDLLSLISARRSWYKANKRFLGTTRTLGKLIPHQAPPREPLFNSASLNASFIVFNGFSLKVFRHRCAPYA